MQKLDWRVWVAVGAGGAAIAAVWLSGLFKAQPDQDAEEHKRRSHINQVGRIAEGQILEILDVPTAEIEAAAPPLFKRPAKKALPAADTRRKLVCYSYSISGVSYETAQDITKLETRTDNQNLVP